MSESERTESKELVRVERDAVPENLYVDEGMVLLERAIERGLVGHPSAEEVRAFDGAVRDILKDMARHAEVRRSDHDGEEE